VLAVIGILASLLLPSLSKSKEKARQLSCANNIKQLTAGTLMFADDDEQGV